MAAVARGRRSTRQRAGYSLIEIGLAICVMSVGILGVLAAFSFALRSVDHAKYMSEALNAGRQIMEEIRAYNVPDWGSTWPTADSSGLFDAPDVRRPINAPPFDSVHPADSFSRNVLLHRMSTVNSDYHFTMALITVTVYWKEAGVEKSIVLRSEFKQP